MRSIDRNIIGMNQEHGIWSKSERKRMRSKSYSKCHLLRLKNFAPPSAAMLTVQSFSLCRNRYARNLSNGCFLLIQFPSKR